MKVTGIIAEYNPFHNGHFYQLKTARERTEADYLIVAMSGDFVQRGAPAITDKYIRAKTALCCGADLILELPVLWACASAEYFAKAGIALLDRLQIVDAVCFGCETPDADALSALARFLSEEPYAYRSALNASLKMGNSYPKARQEAVLVSLPDVSGAMAKILSSPNNILGLEYCKALYQRNSSIRPYPIQRIGGGYHEKDFDSDFVSATGIRSYLSDTMDLCSDLSLLKRWMPKQAYAVLEDSLTAHPLLFDEDFSALLGLRLLLADSFETFADSSADLSNRLLRMRKNYRSIPEFLEQLKTKEVTYTRLSRLLTHILLDIHKQDYEIFQNLDYIPYIKILGFREQAAPLLKALKAACPLPLLDSSLDKKNLLSGDARDLLEKDIFASELYRLAAVQKSGFSIPNECQRKFLKV